MSSSPLLRRDIRSREVASIHQECSRSVHSTADGDTGCGIRRPPPPLPTPPTVRESGRDILPPRPPRAHSKRMNSPRLPPRDSPVESRDSQRLVESPTFSPRLPRIAPSTESPHHHVLVEYIPASCGQEERIQVTLACRSCGGVMERRPSPVVRITTSQPTPRLTSHPPAPPPQPPGPHHLPLVHQPPRPERHRISGHDALASSSPSTTLPVRTHSPHREPPSAPQTLLPPRDIVSLGNSERVRARNEYVDSPTLLAVRQNNENNEKLARQTPPSASSSSSTWSSGSRTLTQFLPPSRPPVVSTQPQPSATTLKKATNSSSTTNGAQTTPAAAAEQQPCRDSIICPQCSKCRCQQCAQPRQLPGSWICKRGTEICSCLCCVQAALYHCCRDENEDFSSDDPCACCKRAHCCERWACMAAMTVCLPCLLLYWPLRLSLWTCTACYNKCSHRGCHCRRDNLPGSKRLLIDSESSST